MPQELTSYCGVKVGDRVYLRFEQPGKPKHGIVERMDFHHHGVAFLVRRDDGSEQWTDSHNTFVDPWDKD
jgi:hypothetical protein